MKKIAFLFVALLGICEGNAQSAENLTGKDSINQISKAAGRPARNDSVTRTIKPSVKLYPNPATSRVEAEINGFEPGFVGVRISDDQGRQVREEERMVIEGNETIVFMFSLKPGIYFLAFKQGKKQASAKLVIR